MASLFPYTYSLLSCNLKVHLQSSLLRHNSLFCRDRNTQTNIIPIKHCFAPTLPLISVRGCHGPYHVTTSRNRLGMELESRSDKLRSNVDGDQYSMADLDQCNMPKHVAVILDGSRRWHEANEKPLDYEPFFQVNMLFADLCLKWGIGTATSFIYSLKNLQRGQEANDFVFGHLCNFLDEKIDELSRKSIRVLVIGERSTLPKSLQEKIKKVEDATKNCTKLELMLAVCYSGTRHIVEATRSISEKVKNGVIETQAIDEALLEQELWTKTSRAPLVDLLIRTGGRLRISDYLIWQLAQTELYFTNICAPDFSELEFMEALRSYQQRERTFGK